ncbi:NACHT domain-containing protein [Actinosynnema sp. CA-299493]
MLLAVMFAVVVVALLTGDLDTGEKLGSVSASFIAMVMSALTVAGLGSVDDRAVGDTDSLADDLAGTVREQWRDEVAARRLHQPRLLPLTWTDGRGTGRLDGPVEEVGDRLARAYGEIRGKRLLLLGEPGSGKTVVAIVLVLGLLRARRPGDPVPVLLSAGSWDPVEESFDDWVVRIIAAEYYNGRRDVATRLLRDDKLLVVLDGLDEMPEIDRRNAVQGVNAALGGDRPIVVTCRIAEYEDMIANGAPPLRKAVPARILPLSGEDAVTYLREVAPWPPGTSWAPVFEVLRGGRSTAVAAALSTPLMVSLARTTYQRCGGDPAQLLDARAFPGRDAVEHHLVHRLVDAAYAPDPLPSGELGTVPSSRWSAAQARRWLAFLARYLHRHRERDLAWWRMGDRLVSPWLAPVFGAAAGLSLLLVIVALGPVAGVRSSENLFLFGLGAGAVLTVLATALWFGTTGREPERMNLRVRGSAARARRGFRVGAAFVLLPAAPLLAGLTVLILAHDSSTFAFVSDQVGVMALLSGLAVVAGASVAAHDWLGDRPEHSTRSTPALLLRQDRRSSLVGATLAGIVAAITSLPLLMVAGIVGELLGAVVAHGLGRHGGPRMDLGPLDLDTPLDQITTAAVLPGVGAAILILFTRAWPRFLLARLALAARRRLPVRLPAFLADARARGLLRHYGGTYQFRHVRLQEQLYARAADTRPADEAVRPRRRLIGLAVVLTLVGALLATWTTYNRFRCAPLFTLGDQTDQTLTTTARGDECVGVVAESEWDRLALPPDVVRRMREGNRLTSARPDTPALVVVAPLRSPAADQADSLARRLDAITAAQHHSRAHRPFRTILVSVPDADHDKYSGSSFTEALQRLMSFMERTKKSPIALLVLDEATDRSSDTVGGIAGSAPYFFLGGSATRNERLMPGAARLWSYARTLNGDRPPPVHSYTRHYWIDSCRSTKPTAVFIPDRLTALDLFDECPGVTHVVLGYTPDAAEMAEFSPATVHYSSEQGGELDHAACDAAVRQASPARTDGCDGVQTIAFEAVMAVVGERTTTVRTTN